MRHTIAFVFAALLIVGGCWVTNDRSSRDASAPDDGQSDPAESAQQADDSAVEQPDLADPLPRVEGQFYEAFDLLTNRPLAHRTGWDERGRSVWIEGGRYDFVRYVLGNHLSGWQLDAGVEDGGDGHHQVAAVRGRKGRLMVPAFAADAEQLQFRLFNPAPDYNELSVRMNGRSVGSQQLEEGWQTVSFRLDDDIAAADNEIRIEFSNLGRIEGRLSGGGLDWIRLGPETDRVPEGPHRLNDDQGGPLSLDPDRGLSWMVWLHDDASVKLEVEADEGCGPRVEIGVEDGDGGVETVQTVDVQLVEGRGEVQTTAIDTGLDEEQVGRLHIAGGDDACGAIDIHDARLVRPGTVDGVPDRVEPPRYVVFWVIDTLRADFLPIHFDSDVKAPNLKRLADEGVSFETAYVQGTESRASHASLFTGKYPDRHGVMEGGTVNPQLPILSHFFQDVGYSTANLVANGYVSHLLNLDRGWDQYRNYIHDEVAVDAESILADGLAWMETLDEEEKFFLYLGTIDPHATYRRHDEFIELYEPADYQGRYQRHLSGVHLEEIKAGTRGVSEREKERIINLYKNEITYNDHVFGQLRQALEEKGIWEETLVVVTADHGEEFWEHGSVGHGHNVHQEMVHVPLMFHYPAQFPQGRTVRSGAEVVDVAPTIRDLLGKQPLDDRQGHSLVDKIFGEHGGYPAPALATQYQLEYGLQIRHWKIIVDSGGFDLFDRSTDPLETEDVTGDHPLASRWLQDSVSWFRAYREDWDKARWGVTTNVSDRFLEYVGGE